MVAGGTAGIVVVVVVVGWVWEVGLLISGSVVSAVAGFGTEDQLAVAVEIETEAEAVGVAFEADEGRELEEIAKAAVVNAVVDCFVDSTAVAADEETVVDAVIADEADYVFPLACDAV